MYLFFDTETTGLPLNYKAPVSDVDNWPRLVQLAYLYYSNDGKVIEGGDFIIKPQGFVIPPDVAKIHGITHQRALEEGLPLQNVLNSFTELIEESTFLVAHNMSFDEKILGAEFLRAGMPNHIDKKKKVCTMLSSVNFCAIPSPRGFKWPKLSELHIKLFGHDFDEAHNAAHDINATAKCFWELRKIGVL